MHEKLSHAQMFPITHLLGIAQIGPNMEIKVHIFPHCLLYCRSDLLGHISELMQK